jgi:glycosyltransferase involved in cell wall biosynthesis
LKKWPPTIIPFYAELATQFPDIAWEFVGCPGEWQSALTAACRGRTVFHPAGWRQRTLLSRWDVLLYSNPALPESFGRTAAEAMRAGCIPVVDRLGGFIEQIPDDCGFLCSSPADFARALDQASDVAVRRTMSRRAPSHADHHFSLRRFRHRLMMRGKAGDDVRKRH